MVLLDSLTPRAMTALPTYPTFYASFRRASGLMPTLARMGVGQLVFRSAGSTLPPSVRHAERAFATSPREQRLQRDELAALPVTFQQAQRLSTLGDIPLAVLTAGDGMQAGWLAEQRRMATLSSNSLQRTARLEHSALVQERAGAAASSDAIASVVKAVRTGGRVLPSPS